MAGGGGVVAGGTVARGTVAGGIVGVLVVGLLTAPALGGPALGGPARGTTMVGDDAGACVAAATAVDAGLARFTEDMRRVSGRAGAGDLAGARASVRDGGATLRGVGDELAAIGRDAGAGDTGVGDTGVGDIGVGDIGVGDAGVGGGGAGSAGGGEVSVAVIGLADTFGDLGESLTNLESLRTLDPDDLEAGVQALKRACGGAFRPGPAPSSQPASTAPPEQVTATFPTPAAGRR